MSNDPTSWLSQVKFWLLLIFSIPSALCSLLILIHFYQQRHNLSIHHHLTLLLTIISFLQVTTQLPPTIAYYRRGEVIPAVSAFCTWWTWWDYSLNGISRFTMAWGSVERHFLIFKITLMGTKRKRFIFHILPTLITSIFPVLFYFTAIILSSCEQHWDYTSVLCRAPCYVIDRSNFLTYEIIGVIGFPILAIFIANIFLIFRVVHQKRRHHVAWRRQRKLTLQLLVVAFIYILFWFPSVFDALFYIVTGSYIAQQLQVNYFSFLVCMIPILLPYTLLVTLPELMKKIFKKRQRAVGPAPNIH